MGVIFTRLSEQLAAGKSLDVLKALIQMIPYNSQAVWAHNDKIGLLLKTVLEAIKPELLVKTVN
jgi:hypothetical protein